MARRIAAEGHDLGNHTWSHRSLWLSGPGETGRQVIQGHDAIAQAAGTAPRFFRPPWGLTNLALFPHLRRLGTPCVFWTVQPEGRRAAEPSAQISRVGGAPDPAPSWICTTRMACPVRGSGSVARCLASSRACAAPGSAWCRFATCCKIHST